MQGNNKPPQGSEKVSITSGYHWTNNVDPFDIRPFLCLGPEYDYPGTIARNTL